MHLLMSNLITEHLRAVTFHFLSLGFLGVFLLLKRQHRNILMTSEVNLLTRETTFCISLPTALSLLVLKETHYNLKLISIQRSLKRHISYKSVAFIYLDVI